MITWDERFSTGNKAIDGQHKMLFRFYNDFEQLIDAGQLKYWEVDGIPFLEEYTKAHFCFEEKCMTDHHCLYSDQNKEAHEAFMATVQEFKKKIALNECHDETLKELHAYIGQWIVNHVIGIDTHLKECIQ